jgi:hypothetical protein
LSRGRDASFLLPLCALFAFEVYFFLNEEVQKLQFLNFYLKKRSFVAPLARKTARACSKTVRFSAQSI